MSKLNVIAVSMPQTLSRALFHFSTKMEGGWLLKQMSFDYGLRDSSFPTIVLFENKVTAAVTPVRSVFGVMVCFSALSKKKRFFVELHRGGCDVYRRTGQIHTCEVSCEQSSADVHVSQR